MIIYILRPAYNKITELCQRNCDIIDFKQILMFNNSPLRWNWIQVKIYLLLLQYLDFCLKLKFQSQIHIKLKFVIFK
ncbi:unnamed protein product [Paramecium pentaurelia]|uniref:Uncharacterized protein n=1 Tax=Paramecium pentaurelia TaxID=43138 RepID=A0A8S1V7H6_9CILI|nr:unnamed protein product [Paramecium pentaurelia]